MNESGPDVAKFASALVVDGDGQTLLSVADWDGQVYSILFT